jgi:hypothetical protein
LPFSTTLLHFLPHFDKNQKGKEANPYPVRILSDCSGSKKNQNAVPNANSLPEPTFTGFQKTTLLF